MTKRPRSRRRIVRLVGGVGFFALGASAAFALSIVSQPQERAQAAAIAAPSSAR